MSMSKSPKLPRQNNVHHPCPVARVATVRAFLTVGSLDKPTVNSKRELTVPTLVRHTIERVILWGQLSTIESPRGRGLGREVKATIGNLLVAFVAFVLACSLARGKTAENPADADAYVQQFESSYRDVKSLRAAFIQTYTLGGTPRIESGSVFFARGGLMRWDYLRPMEKLFVSDGKEVQFYVPEEHQLTRTPVKLSGDYRIPFELLLTRLNLRRVFARVEMADSALEHEPGDHVLRGFPKKEFAGDYTDVLIELSPQFDIRRLVVDYPDHGRMEFEFEHIERNPSFSPSLFEFQPPAGTEIINQR